VLFRSINECLKWFKTQPTQTFEYSGPPGSGKTEIIREIIKRLKFDIDDEVLFMAYTGKAASNLSLRGLPASSMHAALMDYVEVPKLDSDNNRIYKNGRILTMMSFKPKSFLSKSTKLLVIDEASFVDDEMSKIALSFGLPIICTGDIDQLGPIYGSSYFLKKPNYILTEIVRQKGHFGIVEFANRIRLGQEIPNKKYQFGNDCFIIPKELLSNTLLVNAEIILCAKNKTRNYFNDRIRYDIFNIKSKLPVKGEKLICRNNNWNRILNGVPLINGTIGYLAHDIYRNEINVKAGTVKIDFRPDYIEHDYYESLPIDIEFFTGRLGSKEMNRFNTGVKMESANAITVHLSQGSQFDSVVAWDEVFGDAEMSRRIRYTMATRASKLLVYAV
jgi:exodeoxyribonuclease-5